MRSVAALLLILLLVSALACAALYLYLRHSLPKLEGEVSAPELTAAVDVLRDAYGIPHIFAASQSDAAYALGYAHAQDRLWQMEMNRRIGSGRLAEILGPSALDTDRFLRTIGVHRSAKANLDRMDGDTRELLAAYAAGVNAFLGGKPVLPVEFQLLGVHPEPWTPLDSIVWVKMMAWDLGGNWRNELLRMRLAKTLSLARIQEFLPPYPGEISLPIADLKELYGTLERETIRLAGPAGGSVLPDLERLLAAAPPDALEGAGSNNWAVAGKHSTSGKPLLANDPHLGLTAPALWYFAHLHTPQSNIIGATLPGVPSVALGRNDHMAWGFTNTGPDVQDLFLEKLEPGGGYLTPDGPRPFSVVAETIKVKGAADVRLEVRLSRHGPIISDVARSAADAMPRGYALAFSWTALAEDDQTVRSAFDIGRSTNWTEFLAAAKLFNAPQQNMLYADVEGNIGFVAAGRVPVRKRENDLRGLAPAPGWLARYDWDGYIPFADLPQSYNPAGGRLWTANEKILPPGYAHFITSEWQPPYRSGRIGALLEATAKHDSASFARIQADAVSTAMQAALPHLLATEPRSVPARTAIDLLARWNGEMRRDAAEPLIISAWWRDLTRRVYADELGDAFQTNWLTRVPFMLNVLADRDGQSRWCDDVRTPGTETCAQLLALSLESALAELRGRYGEDMAAWRWGEAHQALHEHRPFSRQALLARIFDIRVPSAGDAYTVNVGRTRLEDESQPYASRHAASLRAIYDLSDLEKSLFIHSGGQSGNRLSQHYASFARAWADGEYVPMITERRRLEAAPHQTLRLVPAR